MSTFEQAISDLLEYYAIEIKRNFVDQNVNATGRTSRSIEIDADGSEGNLLAGEAIRETEEGTAPKSEGGGISLAAAQLWIDVKPAEINVYALYNRINKKGTRLFEEGGRTSIFTDVINNGTTEDVFLNNIATEATTNLLEGFDL